MISLGWVFRATFEQKATGLGAVAGGLTEMFVLWGIGTMIISQVVAIILLVRAFSPGHWVRSSFSVLSICLSGFTLVLVFYSLWLLWFRIHHTS
jgi:hypothetical protein